MMELGLDPRFFNPKSSGQTSLFHEVPWLVENEKVEQSSQGHSLRSLLGSEPISGFPEKWRNETASLALLQTLLENLTG